VLEEMQARLERTPDAMRTRRCTVEHPYGTIKAWMGATHFLMKGMKNVKTEMSLHVLAYNFKRLIAILGIADMMKAIKAFIRLCRLKTALLAIFESTVMSSLKRNIAQLRASWTFQTRQQPR
jgi:transposase